jgi:tetratricopeptide (TPR) repeat protein
MALSLTNCSKTPPVLPPAAYYRAGTAAEHRGQSYEALEAYNEEISHSRASALVFYHRGQVQIDLHSPEGAESDYTVALDLSRHGDRSLNAAQRERAFYNRGIARVSLEKWSAARHDLTRAVHVFPEDARAWDNLGYALYRMHAYGGAIDALSHGLDRSPNDPDDRYARADSFYATGHYRRAISDLTIAIRQRPGFGRAYLLRGRAEARVHMYRAAQVDFSRTLHWMPKSWAWVYRCETRESLGNLRGALSDCNRAVQYYPRWSSAYLDRGWAQAALGFNGAALEDMRRAVAYAPSSPNAYLWLGRQLARTGRYHAAFAEYAHALRLSPGNPQIIRAQIQLAQWISRAQRSGIDMYGINSVDAATGIHPRPLLKMTASRVRMCKNTFPARSEYIDDCLDNGISQAKLDRYFDEKAAYQVAVGHYHINAYVKARLAEKRKHRS